MKSTEKINEQLQNKITRRDELAAQLDSNAAALDELRLKATASGDITRLRDALATQAAYTDIADALDREITALRFDLDSAGRAENRAELLYKLKPLTAAGEASFDEIRAAWIEGQDAIRGASERWLDALNRHRTNRNAMAATLREVGSDTGSQRELLEELRADGVSLAGIGAGANWHGDTVFDCAYTMPTHDEQGIFAAPLMNGANWIATRRASMQPDG